MLIRAARLYYEHSLTHYEIAELLGVSRVSVTRMLAEARRKGIVEIRVHGEARTFADVESQLIGRHGIRDAWIVPSSRDPDRLLASLGAGAAHSLRSHLGAGMTVAVNQSASVAAMVSFLDSEWQADARFVPLVGSWGGVGSVNAHETSEAVARALGGEAHHLPAPAIMRTAEAASALLNEPDISDSLKLAANADIMLVGIGLLRADSYLIRQRVLPLTALATVRAAGAVGDISARFFDANGCAVPSEVDDRVIGLTFAQHCAIPCRIGVAGGTRKREAILAAVRGGLVNVIVTDVETGRWLADQPDPASAGSASAARPVAFDLRSRDPVGEESAGTDSSRT